jgi:hypothetical protein
MLEIMTRLGHHTGFSVEEVIKRDEEFGHAEIQFWGDEGVKIVGVFDRQKRRGGQGVPYILKHPRFSLDLISRCELYNWRVDHVYIFVRPFEAILKSGRALKGHRTVERWREIILENTGSIVLTVNEHDLPHTYVRYPLFVQDFNYFAETMDFLVHDFPRESLFTAWAESIDIWKVKDYEQ